MRKYKKLPDGTVDPNPTRNRTFILEGGEAQARQPLLSRTSEVSGLEADIQAVQEYYASLGRYLTREEALRCVP